MMYIINQEQFGIDTNSHQTAKVKDDRKTGLEKLKNALFSERNEENKPILSNQNENKSSLPDYSSNENSTVLDSVFSQLKNVSDPFLEGFYAYSDPTPTQTTKIPSEKNLLSDKNKFFSEARSKMNDLKFSNISPSKHSKKSHLVLPDIVSSTILTDEDDDTEGFIEAFSDPYGEKKIQAEPEETLDTIHLNSFRTNLSSPKTPTETKYDLTKESGATITKYSNQKLTPDEIEFGKDSETAAILKDLSKRWFATSDPAEKERLHNVAEEVRRLARGGNRVKNASDEIFKLLHENAATAQNYQKKFENVKENPFFETGSINPFLNSAGYLISMTDHGIWDYKWNPYWQVQGNGENNNWYNGQRLDQDNNKNWLPWLYFDGYLIGADKLGNINMAYVGDKMGLSEWVYNNILTRDKDDAFWVEYGRDLSRSGR